MIASGRHAAKPVEASGQPRGDGSTKATLSVTSVIDTLEERKRGRVGRSRRVQSTAEVLNRDMNVPDDIALVIDSLGRRIIGGSGICERSGLQISDLQSHVEGLVRSNILAILGEGQNRRDHVRLRRNVSHY